MFSVGLLVLLGSSAGIKTVILEDLGRADLEVLRIRLEEEKAKRLLLQNDVEVLMLQVEELKRKCGQRDEQGAHGNVSLVTHGIAFTATLSLGTTYVHEQTVIFDHTSVSEGNCYDSSNGIFKAPARRLYFSSLTLHDGGSFCIMKDKDDIGRLFFKEETGSVTVLAVMDEGQVVYVKNIGVSEIVNGGYISTFTGLVLD